MEHDETEEADERRRTGSVVQGVAALGYLLVIVLAVVGAVLGHRLFGKAGLVAGIALFTAPLAVVALVVAFTAATVQGVRGELAVRRERTGRGRGPRRDGE